MQEIDLWEMADLINDDRAIEEQEMSSEAEIIMQNVDPSVRNAWEEEMVNPSPKRQQDDGGPAIIV